jgi:hypothetical protein
MSGKSQMAGNRKVGHELMIVSASRPCLTACLVSPISVTPRSRSCHFHVVSCPACCFRIDDLYRREVSMVAGGHPRQWLVPLMWEAEK